MSDRYKVINHEEQYTLWPAERAVPLGWKDAGRRGSESACLDYIEEVWTDMRPTAVRTRAKELASKLSRGRRG